MAIVREDEVSCQGVEGKGEDGRKKYCLPSDGAHIVYSTWLKEEYCAVPWMEDVGQLIGFRPNGRLWLKSCYGNRRC